MIRGFYSATAGLISQQISMDLIANNIANISTPGFKPTHGGFASLLHENIYGGSHEINMGHGVRVETTATNYTSGELLRTDLPHDFAIVGDGFFAVETKDSKNTVYKRDGSFQISLDGGKQYLVDSSGRFLLDENKKRVELGEGFDVTKIGVFKFPNVYALTLDGGNGFLETEASGKAEAMKDAIVKQGYIEGSRAEASFEMVKMIEASKAFSLNSKVIQTADEIEKTINQLR